MRQLEIKTNDQGRVGILLHKVHFFSNLTMGEAARILNFIQVFEFKKGDYVFKQGAPADALYIIANGKLGVYKKTMFLLPKRKINVMGPGEFFGELALLNNKPRAASIKALSDAKLYFLQATDFDKVLTRNPEFEHNMHKIADRHIHQSPYSLPR